jgi:hypothetical protein
MQMGFDSPEQLHNSNHNAKGRGRKLTLGGVLGYALNSLSKNSTLSISNLNNTSTSSLNKQILLIY